MPVQVATGGRRSPIGCCRRPLAAGAGPVGGVRYVHAVITVEEPCEQGNRALSSQAVRTLLHSLRGGSLERPLRILV